jgi:translation initiation factor IF-2
LPKREKRSARNHLTKKRNLKKKKNEKRTPRYFIENAQEKTKKKLMARDKNTTVKDKVKIATRPPIVAVLGHVDHGKTTLLDHIRKTHVAEREFGSITQHIGAYQVEHQGRRVTFIDTPGHEAFSTMRARGGQVADLAVLVVAADDGVMPQTKESIAHIKAANIPFLVAINKTDLPNLNIEKTKKQLSEAGVLVEGYGGDVVTVPISAKTGQGVKDLLEMTLLMTDLQELERTDKKPFSGVIIEAKLDKFKGPLATVLVKEGILRVGDLTYSPTTKGKVKYLMDANGKGLKEAHPSTPVEILGFSSVPKVGEQIKNTSEEHIETAEKPKELSMKQKIGIKTEEDEIKLIVKADVQGTLEAITQSLENLKSKETKVKIYYSATGDIIENDVLLAAATKSLILGFNVSISKTTERLATEEGVLIRRYNLIYELLDELKEGLGALSEKQVEDEILGEAKIIKKFERDGASIAGCTVTKGRINKSDRIIIRREEKEIGRGKVISMKHRESNINEASEGDEFGLILEKGARFTKGDIILAIGRSETK